MDRERRENMVLLMQLMQRNSKHDTERLARMEEE
jgi:hypothetical protein